MYFEVEQLGKIAIKSQFQNDMLISYTNAFSSGLFLAVGIVHILPEAHETLAEYIDYPIAFLIAIMGFSLILFVEKIIFRNVEENPSCVELQQLDKQGHHQAILLDNFDHQHTNQLIRSLKHNQNNLKPYLLSTAIGLHAVFEGIALGVTRRTSDTLALGLSLMGHKWAEGWALGVAFRESSVEQDLQIKFIIFSALLSPVGIIIGMLIASESIFVTGIVQSITAGTFIYIASTELIVEEFNKNQNKTIKFILYLLGIMLMSFIVYLE
ncbi:unnamed protein product (macronuclear) [Paramecium tetraurelia]|uniref:Zinc/iron permease n=1 Tax=Paramecium tetraurelia TaxID=5888 RepID=A0EHH7_PARTE|nr:uncharacterized protein GSPATT00027092001 [Paramecium tetraurelia]CAK94768.1 unnamed protein product [Paramecium tetraurelia]|eukprot:XP_001462141.1 hypothetical protein (macronuclear) [Paramecium tetraurelia strain d4-2]